MLYCKKQQAAAVPVVASAADMASTMLHQSPTSKPERRHLQQCTGQQRLDYSINIEMFIYENNCDQVFVTLLNPVSLLLLLLLLLLPLLLKIKKPVKWRMYNNQFDYKNTDERLTFRRIFGRSEFECGCA